MHKPAYRYFMKPGAEVMVSRKKWRTLPRKTRLLSVLEEAYVLAIERSQVPHKGKISARDSFDIALMKVCTSITSGWWRDFAWENYDDVVDLYNDDYIDRFWKAVEDGTVKEYQHEANASQALSPAPRQ
jgi:hypothetical protein